VAFTRLEGVIAYRIGDKETDSPKILIEKERFLPILLKYKLPGDPPGEIITVKFKDYRTLEQGWYPYEIHYVIKDRIMERYITEDLQVNATINPYLFATTEMKSGSDQSTVSAGSSTDEERLRQIIKSFERKYGE